VKVDDGVVHHLVVLFEVLNAGSSRIAVDQTVRVELLSVGEAGVL
jgi:hypothetical protein